MPRSIPLRPAPLALSLSLFASFSAPALAADPVEQQMVVIGSRAPTSISELPGTVWVIEREQLDQQTQAGVPLKEALGQLIPGLDIGSQGRTNNGQNLRGRSVLVMIDGVSLNSSRGISRQFDSIDPFNIERIEVMSGASAVYGGGATGGIINIVTKKGVGGDTRFNTELGARSGFQSHEDHDLRAAQSISGGNDLFNGRLAIAYQKNGAAYDGSGDQVLTDITQTDLQYNRSVDLMGSLGFTFANGHSLDLGLQYYDSGYDGDRGLDLGRNFDALRGRAPYSIKGGVDLDREPESKRHQFNATYHAPEVLGHDLYLQAYYRNEKMAFNPFPTIRYSNSGAINYGTSYYSASQQDTDYYGMKLALVKTWERASLTYGVDLDREKFTSDQMLFNLPLAAASGGLVASEQAKLGRYPDIDTDSRAFFLQGSWKATDDLTLSAGVRRQSMSTDVSDFVAANQQILIANGLGKTADAVPGGSKDYDVNLVNVGAIYKLNLQQQVWANYSEGFELPDPAKYYGFDATAQPTAMATTRCCRGQRERLAAGRDQDQAGRAGLAAHRRCPGYPGGGVLFLVGQEHQVRLEDPGGAAAGHQEAQLRPGGPGYLLAGRSLAGRRQRPGHPLPGEGRRPLAEAGRDLGQPVQGRRLRRLEGRPAQPAPAGRAHLQPERRAGQQDRRLRAVRPARHPGAAGGHPHRGHPEPAGQGLHHGLGTTRAGLLRRARTSGTVRLQGTGADLQPDV